MVDSPTVGRSHAATTYGAAARDGASSTTNSSTKGATYGMQQRQPVKILGRESNSDTGIGWTLHPSADSSDISRLRCQGQRTRGYRTANHPREEPPSGRRLTTSGGCRIRFGLAARTAPDWSTPMENLVDSYPGRRSCDDLRRCTNGSGDSHQDFAKGSAMLPAVGTSCRAGGAESQIVDGSNVLRRQSARPGV